MKMKLNLLKKIILIIGISYLMPIIFPSIYSEAKLFQQGERNHLKANSNIAAKSQCEIGYRYLKQKDYSNAVKEFQKVLINYPNCEDATKIRAHSSIAQCFFAQKKYDQAIIELREGLPFCVSGTQSAATHFLIASYYKEQKEYIQAIRELELIIKKYPNTQAAQIAKSEINLFHNSEYMAGLEKMNTFPYKYEVDILLFSPRLYLIYDILKYPFLKIFFFSICIFLILLVRYYRKTYREQFSQQISLDLKNVAKVYILTLSLGPLLILVCFILLGNEFKLLSPYPWTDLLVNLTISLTYIIIPITYVIFKKFGFSSLGFARIKIFHTFKWISISFLFLLVTIVINYLFLSNQGNILIDDSIHHLKMIDNIPHLIKVAKDIIPSISFFISSFFILGILRPIGEEIIFRGIVYTAFRKQVGVLLAVVIESMLFASCHLTLRNFVILFMYGVIFTILYERTKSLYPSIIVHSIFSSFILLIMFFNK